MHGPVVVAGEVAAPGRSTLITRAPRSASCRVANGAATACSSATTMTPSSGSAAGHAGPVSRGHGATEFRLTSWRAITLRWISLVPSPTIISGASRK